MNQNSYCQVFLLQTSLLSVRKERTNDLPTNKQWELFPFHRWEPSILECAAVFKKGNKRVVPVNNRILSATLSCGNIHTKDVRERRTNLVRAYSLRPECKGMALKFPIHPRSLKSLVVPSSLVDHVTNNGLLLNKAVSRVGLRSWSSLNKQVNCTSVERKLQGAVVECGW